MKYPNFNIINKLSIGNFNSKFYHALKGKTFWCLTITVLVLANIVIYYPQIYKNLDTAKSMHLKKFFSSGEEYANFISKNVRFRDLKFYTIKIKKGDNYWKIAKQYGVNIDTLIGTNPQWHSLIAKVNKQIIVPSEKGVLHFISNFDELDELQRIYDTEPDNIKIQTLPLLYKYYYKFLKESRPIAVFIKNIKPKTFNMTDKLAKQFMLREMFRSPLGGRYSSFYGRRKHPIFRKRHFHNGIDIATGYGTLVGATAAGRIVYTGWMGGYGKAVVIQHANGYKTLYGHLSRINTRRGRYIKSGSIIGKVGSTGNSTGPHLHFTLWHYGKLINPMKILW
ncbi:M23 family metallopeptidase [Spirochaetota bacterium]